MSEHNHNNFERVGEFAVDAGIDTGANSIANRIIDGVASHIPGGRSIEPMLETEADLILDNSINRGVNERLERVEEMFENPQRHNQRAEGYDQEFENSQRYNRRAEEVQEQFENPQRSDQRAEGYDQEFENPPHHHHHHHQSD